MAAPCLAPAPAPFAAYAPAEAASVPAPPSPRTPGYLHAEGARIVDHRGATVRLMGVSWFGLETARFAPHGLDRRSLESLLDQVARLGYNTLRIPYSNELLTPGVAPAEGAIDLDHNPDLAGLTGLEVLDRIVAEAGQRGLYVVLDRHVPYASDRARARRACTEDGPWYAAGYGEARWIRDWQALAARYLGDPTVVGFDLSNEPDATWGDGVARSDWRAAAERAGDAILAVNPELLIFVQGVTDDERFEYGHYWAGGNLAGARADPVRLAVPSQLVYSVHDYPGSVAPQPWFAAPDFPDNLAGVWDAAWGYLATEDLAPVFIGEFGTRLESAQDRVWLDALLDYADAVGASFAVWSLNPDSDDTGGVLEDDWRTVRVPLQDRIAPHLVPAPVKPARAPAD